MPMHDQSERPVLSYLTNTAEEVVLKRSLRKTIFGSQSKITEMRL